MEADRLQQSAQQRPPVHKRPGHRNLPRPQRQAQAEGGIGHHRLARAGQQRQVGPGVADVVELPEAGLQKGQFLSAGEVGHAVGGQHAGEDAQMRRHALRQRAIRAACQIELPALAPLNLQVTEQIGVVGQPDDIERRAARHLRFQAGAPLGQPQRQLPEPEGIPVQELASRIEERVRLDQRPVQIDAQRPREAGGFGNGRAFNQCILAGIGCGSQLQRPYILRCPSKPKS
jgi:hypothetical protein